MSRDTSKIKLSRDRDQRRALLKGLANSLVLSESIVTTRPKAKALVPGFEKLITKAKQQNLHSLRQIRASVTTEAAALKIYNDLAKRFAQRPGGYTSLKREAWRKGDDVELVRVSLTAGPAPAPESAAKAKVSAQAPAAKKPPATAKVKVGA